MDLIYTNTSLVDVGVLHDYQLDFEVNSEGSENTFEIQMALNNMCMDKGCYWYIDGTMYGGCVDAIKIDTSASEIYYTGRTWFGMLNSKIIVPDSGSSYYKPTGDLNTIISGLISRVGLTSIFSVATTTTKTVTFQFDRYVSVFSGIVKMLAKNGYKLTCYWSDGKCVLEAVALTDWSNEMEMSSDLFDFKLQKNYSAPNHMIGLGYGELKDRQVCHKYIDSSGNVSDTQYYTGLEEITETYDKKVSINFSDDDTSTERAEKLADALQELKDETAEKLADAAIEDSLQITANDIDADLGDKFTAVSLDAGISVTQYVTQKISTITEDDCSVQYSVGASMY